MRSENERTVALITFQQLIVVMARKHSREEDDASARRGAEKLRKLLANPEEFERWANDILDRSRKRRR